MLILATTPPAYRTYLDKAASGTDLVVGSRYVPGGSVVGTTQLRKLISYSANWLAHLFLGVSIRDCTAGFRCYRRVVLETIELEKVFSTGYSFLIEMAFLCQKAGFRIGEIPITFVNRTEGASKISKTEIYRAFYTLASACVPSRFLGTVSLATFNVTVSETWASVASTVSGVPGDDTNRFAGSTTEVVTVVLSSFW